MALRKRVPVPMVGAGDAPEELRVQGHPLWDDVRASRAWFVDRGFAIPARFDVGPLNRHAGAVLAWGFANGCRRDDFPQLVDWHKLRACGVEPPGGAARERWAYLQAAGGS